MQQTVRLAVRMRLMRNTPKGLGAILRSAVTNDDTQKQCLFSDSGIEARRAHLDECWPTWRTLSLSFLPAMSLQPSRPDQLQA